VATPLRALKNLGPRSEAMLAAAGIGSAEALRRSDPFEVYLRVRAGVPGASLNLLYAMIGALEDRHWHDVRRDRCTEIQMRLDDRQRHRS
jgi:DNA transformation protein